jgi:Fe-S-cluster containining protein
VSQRLPHIRLEQFRRALAPIEAKFADQRARYDSHPCRKGCDACCHGPFDVSTVELWRIVEGLLALPDAQRKAALRRIRTAAQVQFETLGLEMTGEVPTVENLGEDVFDELCDALEAQPCPLLENHECVVYSHRPRACTMRGGVWRDDFCDDPDESEIDMSCPIGLTDNFPNIAYPVLLVDGQFARLEARQPYPGIVHDERTTIALGLHAFLKALT